MSFFHTYRKHRFNSAARQTVDQANEIINDMMAQGYQLTLRQLYYQFVSKALIDNTEKQYKRLGRLITHAREAGEMDWNAIHDAGRGINAFGFTEEPDSILDSLEYSINFDQWARQDVYIEVWVEKQALEGVIKKPCNRYDVRYMACKGYLSASEAWRAGQRFQKARDAGKTPILIHLADHDPSGLNMTEDNRSRVRLFAEDQGVEVRRIALNMDQVDEHNPPPNPAKESDSRAKAYIAEYGSSSWELDALPPKTIDGLIDEAINDYRDVALWDKVRDMQKEAREPLAQLSSEWVSVQGFLALDDTYREVLSANEDLVREFLESKDLI